MNNKLISIGAFIVGAAIGSVITWKIIKTKYEQFAQEQIDWFITKMSQLGYSPEEAVAQLKEHINS